MDGRFFFAIDLSSEARARVRAVVQGLQSDVKGAKWVRAENYHLTLLFLGEQENRVVEGISKGAGQLTRRQAPFSLTLSGLGCFPNPSRARVLYIGVIQGADIAADLAGQFHNLAQIPFSNFRPHLTLARFRQPSVLNLSAIFAPITVPVQEITLFASTLTPAGPVYRAVDKFSLSGIARGE